MFQFPGAGWSTLQKGNRRPLRDYSHLCSLKGP